VRKTCEKSVLKKKSWAMRVAMVYLVLTICIFAWRFSRNGRMGMGCSALQCSE
jgi:hypothetical protein